LLPYRRTQAVSADQYFGLHRAAIAEVNDNALQALLESPKTDTAVIMLCRERIAQYAINALPGRENLRAFALGNHLSDAIENLALRHRQPKAAGIDSDLVQVRD
jgi:hypothetical protein